MAVDEHPISSGIVGYMWIYLGMDQYLLIPFLGE
jgi:hypothetical protein